MEFINERPIREFGKQALILGIIERIYDNYYINEFITKNKELHFNIHIVNLSSQEQNKKNKKIQPNKKIQTNCLFTDSDFPPLSIK